MIFIYTIGTLAFIRLIILLRDIHTGRYLQHNAEWGHGYATAQSTYNSVTGKYELRSILRREFEQGRFTKHWYGAACWLADAEGKPWPRPWGERYYEKPLDVIGTCIQKTLYGIGWLTDNPWAAVALASIGILIGGMLI